MRPDLEIDSGSRDFRGPPPMEMRGRPDMRGPGGSDMMDPREFRGGPPSMERDEMRMREMRGPSQDKGLYIPNSLVFSIDAFRLTGRCIDRSFDLISRFVDRFFFVDWLIGW